MQDDWACRSVRSVQGEWVVGDEKKLIADFGIAKALSARGSGMFGGNVNRTAEYPECVRGCGVDRPKPVGLGRHGVHRAVDPRRVPAEIGHRGGGD